MYTMSVLCSNIDWVIRHSVGLRYWMQLLIATNAIFVDWDGP